MGRRVANIFIGAASLVLAATAALHFTGYTDILAWVSRVDGDDFFATAIPGIWLFPSLHWLLIAIAMVIAAWTKFAALRTVLFCVALVLVADATLIFLTVGPFIGSATLLLSAFLYAGAALKLRA